MSPYGKIALAFLAVPCIALALGYNVSRDLIALFVLIWAVLLMLA